MRARRVATLREARRHTPDWLAAHGLLPPIAGGSPAAAASQATSFTPGTGVTADVSSAQQAQRPYCQAAKRGFAPALTFTGTLSAASATYGPLPLPASGGYMRRLFLQCLIGQGFTGAVSAVSGTIAADGPFSFIAEARFLQPNGTPVLDLSGFNLAMSNIFGGYTGTPDLRGDPDFIGQAGSTTNYNPIFQPFIPIELDTTGRGALADLSSSSAWQLFVQVAPVASLYSAGPGANPSYQINSVAEFWTLPNPQVKTPDGRIINNATNPPFPGTIQLWNQLPNISIASNQRVQLTRMGNQIRTVILVFRSAGARAEGPVPNPFAFRWDDVILWNVDLFTLRKLKKEFVINLAILGGYTTTDLTGSAALANLGHDTGVYVMPYSFGLSRFLGGNGVSSYVPTVTATRWEISGPNTGGTVDWLVNEVTSAPITGVERSSVGGGLQFYPPQPAPGGPGTM